MLAHLTAINIFNIVKDRVTNILDIGAGCGCGDTQRPSMGTCDSNGNLVDVCDIDKCDEGNDDHWCILLDQCVVDYSPCIGEDNCRYDCPCGPSDNEGQPDYV